MSIRKFWPELKDKCSTPLIAYDSTSLPGTCKTDWLGVTLESGAEVRVGLQADHPYGGIGLVHDIRNTQPTGKRTQLRFALTPEAIIALVAMYNTHGILAKKPTCSGSIKPKDQGLNAPKDLPKTFEMEIELHTPSNPKKPCDECVLKFRMMCLDRSYCRLKETGKTWKKKTKNV